MADDIPLVTPYVMLFSDQSSLSQASKPHQRANEVAASDFKDNFTELFTCSTVKEFFRYYQHIFPVSQLQGNQGYHFMQQGIRPMYEDRHHKNCKLLKLSLNKGSGTKVWERLLFMVLRGAFAKDNLVSGIEYRKKPQTEDEFVSLWVMQCSDIQLQEIKDALKRELDFTSDELIGVDNSNKIRAQQ